MQRRKALVLAGALTVAVGTATVAFAAAGGASLLGFGPEHGHGPGSFSAAQAAGKPRVVVRTHNVYDTYVVDGSTGTGGSANVASNGRSVGAAPGSGQVPPNGNGPTPTSTGPKPAGPHPATGTHTPEPSDETPTTAAPANTPPAPQPTTTVPTTPTSLPRGVPADWPKGKPIPPKPVPCYHGQLEDNGIWNCQAPGDD